MLNFFKKNYKDENGTMLITVLVITGIFMAIAMGQVSLVTLRYKLNVVKVAKAQALHVAEAGVNYYRWILYHDHDEYLDRTGCTAGTTCGPFGPYPYSDSADGSITGYYELYITPPAVNGSTIVNIKSIGWLDRYPQVRRSIEVRCGIPSWSSYSTLADDFMRFGEGTEVWGPIHSNQGIRFDGVAHNIVTSALATTTNADSPYNTIFGVYNALPTPADPAPDSNMPPQNVPIKPNVFMAGRSFPVTSVSFNLLSSYINEIYNLATSSDGILFDPAVNGSASPYSKTEYRGCGTSGSTCDEGFHITLKTNNTFDIRGVTSVQAACGGNPSNSIASEEATVRNYPIPSNGVIFVKKTLWVDGQINNSRVTIVADGFSSSTADININTNLLYTNYDGSDAIGLVAQRDISSGLYSDNIYEIDAALIARTGRIGRENYSGCSTNPNNLRDTIKIYGSLATKIRYGFSWISGTTRVSGYETRQLEYDNNLTFAPPPHYPTTGEYTFISWKEN